MTLEELDLLLISGEITTDEYEDCLVKLEHELN